VIPRPWDVEKDSATRIGTICTHALLTAFSQFVNLCESRGLIAAETLPHTVDGTRAYIVSARTTDNVANVADITADECRIRAGFPEVNSSDAMYCAIMVNNFQALANFAIDIAELGPISSLMMTRVEFIRKA